MFQGLQEGGKNLVPPGVGGKGLEEAVGGGRSLVRINGGHGFRETRLKQKWGYKEEKASGIRGPYC
jgi:hypothetical protein